MVSIKVLLLVLMPKFSFLSNDLIFSECLFLYGYSSFSFSFVDLFIGREQGGRWGDYFNFAGGVRTSRWGVSKRRMYKMKGSRQLRNAAVVAIEHYIYTSSSWGGSVVSVVVTHVVLIIIIIIISRTFDLNSSCVNRKHTTVSPAGILVLITDEQNLHTPSFQFSDLNYIFSFLFRLLSLKHVWLVNVFVWCWKSTWLKANLKSSLIPTITVYTLMMFQKSRMIRLQTYTFVASAIHVIEIKDWKKVCRLH